jgi:hypothetical protein
MPALWNTSGTAQHRAPSCPHRCAAAPRVGGFLLSFTIVLLGSCSAPIGGTSAPSPAQLSAEAIRGLLLAANVHYSGTLELLGTPYALQVTANQNGDFHGTLSFPGRSVEVLKAGAQIYHKGSSYWAGRADPVTLRVYGDNWVRTESAQDETPLFALASSDVERDLRDHFVPSRSSAAAVAGRSATKLSGSQGDLYVTASKPVRALRFTSSAGYRSPGGLSRIRYNYQYPVSIDLQQPQQFIDPNDHSTWPAEFQIDKEDQGACDPTQCQLTAVARNVGGAPVGQATATFSLTDAGGHSLGSCTVNIPPIGYNQTEPLSCAVSGSAWNSFVGTGGYYSENVSVHNPVYDN